MLRIPTLKEKVVLITGGGSGIGFAMAKAFAANECRVIITGRRKQVLQDAVVELGNNACYFVQDITNLEEIPALVGNIEKQIGAIDILINNAGIHIKKAAIDLTDDEFNQVILTHQSAGFAITREVAKKMIPRGKGAVLMISSMASRYGIPKVIAYTAAKSAIEGMTRALAVELSPHGIRINCIAPGFIETPMSAKALNADPERKSRVLARTPIGHLGTPSDVADAAVFLVSDNAKYITGTILPVDGGNAIGF